MKFRIVSVPTVNAVVLRGANGADGIVPPIADDTLVGNVSGAAATPTGLNKAAVKTLLGFIENDDMQAALSALDAVYAAISHSHSIEQVSGLQTALDAKASTASVAAGYVALGTSVANRIPKRTGTAGQITDSGITIDASNNVTGAGKITINGAANTDFMELASSGFSIRVYQPADASGIVFYGTRRVGFGLNFTTIPGQVYAESAASTTKTLVLRQASSQSVPVLETQSPGGAAEFSVGQGGSVTIGAGTPITKVLSATATLDFGSIAASSYLDLTMTVTGAAVGNSLEVSVPVGAFLADLVFTWCISSSNTVTIRCANNSTTTARDPGSGTFRATVTQF